MNRYVGALLLVAFGAVHTASAHYLFIMPERFQTEPGETLSIGLHNADSFPESESVARRIERVELREGREATGIAVERDGSRLIGAVTVEASGHIFAVAQTEIATIEIEPEEFVDYLREEGLTQAIEWREQNGETDRPGRERYAKYSKAILLSGEPDATHAQPLGLPIEIVPEGSPYRSTVGDVLPARVLFRGEPAANLELTASWIGVDGTEIQVIGRTDADGRIGVPLVAAGPWRLHAILMERVSEPEVDWESHWAILTFEVP
jgi:hypothetical protein